MSNTNEPERDIREQYLAWKRLVPYLYDSFINHHLTWPSLSCRWGPLVHESSTRRKHRVYLSEQTDGSEPNKLVLVTADIAKPRISTAEAVNSWSDQSRSPHLSAPLKTLIHPGEVNKLLDIPHHPSIVVTHSDTPDVYVWNFDKQPDRSTDLASTNAEDKKPSPADVVLKGHTADAEFALGTCNASPQIASGGKDTNVLVWNLEDCATVLAGGASSAMTTASPIISTELQPRYKLEGHYNTVEDVAFLPGSTVELCSVADDFSLLFWDTRTPAGPTARVARAHGERDVHCCDWSALRPLNIVTGAQDGGVRLWDKRNLGGPLLSINHHEEAVMNVEWSPHKPGLFATGADDGLVCIWDMDAKVPEADGPAASKKQKISAPHQLLFQHAGHQSPVVDFCWNPVDEWTVLSASVDVGAAGGGTLQMWRISDLVYRSDEDIMAELEPFRDYIVNGDESKLPGANGNVNVSEKKEGDTVVVNGEKQQGQGEQTGDELQATVEQTDVEMTAVKEDDTAGN